MKKIVQISALFLTTIFFAQNVSEYQYITIENTDPKGNRYGLNELLTQQLKQKNYIVLPANKEDWQQELRQNPCEILTAEISDTSSMFRNKTTVSFVDCNKKTIASSEGRSMIKDFEPGMREALQSAMVKIAASNQEKKKVALPEKQTNYAEAEIKAAEKKAAEVVTNVDLSKLTDKLETKPASKVDVYTNGTLTLHKILVADGEFILANPTTYIPYAIFKPTSQKDTYRVQLSDKSMTLGYVENGNIVVELPNSDGSFRKEIFRKN